MDLKNKKVWIDAAIILGILVVLDWLFHTYVPGFEVPSYYFVNKVLYGYAAIALMLAFVMPRINSAFWKASTLAAGVTLLLQARYLGFLGGTELSTTFNFVVMLVHFNILYFTATHYFTKGERFV